MATIRFYTKPLKNDTLQVLAKLQQGKEVPSAYTGFTIPATKVKDVYKHWDSAKQRVKGILPNTELINQKLSDWEAAFNRYVDMCKSTGTKPVMSTVKRLLENNQPGSSEHLLLPVIKQFYQSIESSSKDRNIKAYKVLYTQIEKFEKHKRCQYYLHNVTEEFYREYSSYLQTEHNNINNSIKRKITRLTTVMRYAFKKRYLTTRDFDFKPTIKGSSSRKMSLTPDELAKLKKHKCADPFHELVLDAFLFACETGLRHSDIILICPIHFTKVIVDRKPIDILDLTQFKGTKSNTVPLSKEAMSIYGRRKAKVETQKIFPISYSQSISRVLKAIFIDAGIDRQCEVITVKGSETTRETMPLHDLISFHMGRNTYITSLLAKGMPTVYVKDNVGHADIRTTMSYSKQSDMHRWVETLKVQNKKT
jgi:integrase